MPTPYVKQTWIDGVAGATPISAARLTYIEDGIENATVEDGTYAPGAGVSVAAKGADMTGVSGGRAAFLLALADVATGGEIFVPEGTLLLDTAVTTLTPPRLKIKGEGMWASTIKAGFAGAMFNGDNTYATMIEELIIEDICIDLAGLATVGFAFNANTTVKRMVCHNVRFTNITLADAIRIASGNLYLTGNTLFHNPAAHAGRGKAILVGVGGRLHCENTVESHWLGQFFASPTGLEANPDQDITESHYIGGYHDQYWPYIPAVMSGSGGTVTYDATSVTDTGADFTAISAAAYPNVALLRAMPVKETGTTTTASDMQLIDTAATFIANGTKRGDIVRVAGKWAIVEGVQSETVLNILKWFDNTTLLPITRPALGTAYTVYGFIYGFGESKTGTTKINVRYWTDFFGVRTTPSAGTLYEIMQARPSQMLAPGFGTRAIVIPHGARFFRGWADMAGTMQARSVIRGHFKDGQDLGITIAGEDCDIDALIEHCGAGGAWVDGNDTSIGGKFIGNCWNFDNASQPLTPVSVNNSSRCMVKPGTLFKKTAEGTQAITCVKFVGTGTLNSVLDIVNDGHPNDLDVVASTMTKSRIRGIAPVVISSVGTGFAMVNDGHRRYLTADVANAGVTLADVTGLGFPVEASEVWEFMAHIVYDSTTTNDLRLALNVPASATPAWSSDGLSSGATSFLGDRNGSVTTSTTYAIYAGVRAAGAAAVKVSATMRGLVTVGATAGTVIPRFSKNLNTDTTSPADDATVYAGSFLVARRIA